MRAAAVKFTAEHAEIAEVPRSSFTLGPLCVLGGLCGDTSTVLMEHFLY